MTIYETILNELNLEKFYRFQGYLSHNYYNINGSLIKEINSESSYVYFSKNIKHHQYYLTRRIIQLIYREILENSKLQITPRLIEKLDNYQYILTCIRDYQELIPIYSVEIDFCPIFLKLIENNAIRNIRQKSKRKIELVDYKKNGGGYGFCDEWLNLLNNLTCFYRFKKITLEELILFVKQYRLGILYENYQNEIIFPESFWNKNIHIQVNPSIFNDFTKYNIIETIERLFDLSLIEPNSSLGKEPKKMIKKTVKEFEQIRKLTKNKFEKYYQKKY